MILLRVSAVAFWLSIGAWCPAGDYTLPLVQESVDEICVIRTPSSHYDRVVFFRDGKVLASRMLSDEMQWVASGDGFQLTWQDYWTADRIVDTKRLSYLQAEEDPTEAGQNGPWFAMWRRMADLKQP